MGLEELLGLRKKIDVHLSNNADIAEKSFVNEQPKITYNVVEFEYPDDFDITRKKVMNSPKIFFKMMYFAELGITDSSYIIWTFFDDSNDDSYTLNILTPKLIIDELLKQVSEIGYITELEKNNINYYSIAKGNLEYLHIEFKLPHSNRAKPNISTKCPIGICSLCLFNDL